jgi:Radical SAM superfamily/4Fe-4S single cluster domain
MKLSDLKWILLRYRRSCRKRLFKRHRLNHKIIALDITYRCNLKCFNCNRSCRQAPSDETMAVPQVEKFIRETVGQNRTWKEIKIEGGEPTLHPDFFEIIELLRQFKASRAPGTRISLSTNGHGREVRRVLARLPENIIVYNSGKDSPVQDEFYAFNVAPMDLDEYRNCDFTRACDIPLYFGIGLSPFGYYPCTVSAGIDRVFGLDLGRKRLPGKGDSMAEQLEAFCRLCGHFIPFNLARRKEVISPTWVSAYAKYHTQSPRLKLY